YCVFRGSYWIEALLGNAACGARAAGDAGDGCRLDRSGALEGASHADGPAAGGVGRSREFSAGARDGGAERADGVARSSGDRRGGGRSLRSEGGGAVARA